jgi:hypothetical protein
MKPIALALVLASVYFAACGGDDAPTKMDAQGSGHGSAAFGATCTTASETSTECASGICANFGGSILCTQKCTLLMMTDPSCPNGSMGQKCAQQGYCRP